MKLNSITPQNKGVQCINLKVDEFYQLFVDADKKKLKDDVKIERACPVCSTTQKNKIFTKNGLDYCQCSRCRMVYITPYIKEKLRLDWYATSKGYGYFWKEIVHQNRDARIEQIWIPRIKKLKDLKCSFDNVLDVGCGSGEFIDMMLKSGVKKIVGVEPNSSAYEISQKYIKGFVKQGSLQDMTFDNGQCSLITMWEVFHHFDEPLDTLKRLYKLLKKGGKLILQSPNFDGFDYRVLGQCHHDVTFEIPNYFSPETMRAILTAAGFVRDDISITTPGKLDVQYVLSGLELHGDKIDGGAFFKVFKDKIAQGDEKLKDDLQQLLVNHQLSGSMYVVAVKG